MLDIHLIRSSPDLIRQAFLRRGQDPAPLEALLGTDERRRELLQEVESLRAERNRVSEEIGKLKKAGTDAAEMIAEMRRVGDRIKAIEEDLREVEGEFDRLMLEMPNIPDGSVPAGADEEHNVVVREWGEPRTFDFEPKPHWEIAVDLDIVDFERATKIAGANFEVFKGPGARLRRALINFMLDVHTQEHGYTEIAPPVLARRDALIASGHLPKFEDDQFHLRENDMFLIPTAESALANLHRDEMLEADGLPLSYVAYTPCFRYEKFGAGKESRGLIRQFQFDKVELFKFVLPETSLDELESLVRQAEAIYQRLGIPYRLALMCAGEMSMAAAKAYDPMAWFPGTGKWMELSSCSNCLDWQARRANVRFRREKGAKPEFVHTLNGSGLAVGRTFAAILENYQQADGSVTVPEVLLGYMGGLSQLRNGKRSL
jgi:seryl-tRNA synthetase